MQENTQEAELEKLEREYFVLNMKDTWDSGDHKYAQELREKIKKLKESKNDCNKYKF